MKKDSILVVFDEIIPESINKNHYSEVITAKDFVLPGSVHEATSFAEELSQVKLVDGTRISKSFLYQGYELWWMNYNNLFYYFGLPYSQYKKLLEYVINFKNVSLYKPPFENLFKSFIEAHGSEANIICEENKNHKLPFGILLQIIITFYSIPFLAILRKKHLIFIGDKFEKGKDYDFRQRFVYNELRNRNIKFVEFVRSLESWKTVLQHAWKRKRPVIYSEAVIYVGNLLAKLSGSLSFSEKKSDPDQQFKFLIATHYLNNVKGDIWSIRIMKFILKIIGVKSAFFTAALDRNLHAVLGCKLNKIPTVGVLHGAPTRYYNAYDFLAGFDGEKKMSVDKYGVWSEWWKEYYIKYSRAYKPEQLYISGPMRPLEVSDKKEIPKRRDDNGKIRVLFISEQLAAPHEVIPYIKAVLADTNLEFYMKFRPHRDGFEEWLNKNEPEVLRAGNIKIMRGSMQEAVNECDVVVGSHSTAVLEALLQFKTPIFFNTQKWGDCFSFKDYGSDHSFFAENPDELIERIKNTPSISKEVLKDLQERYFGDPYKNGSKWVVDDLVATSS